MLERQQRQLKVAERWARRYGVDLLAALDALAERLAARYPRTYA